MELVWINPFSVFKSSIGVKKNFEFTPYLNYEVLKLREIGTIVQLSTRYHKETERICESETEKPNIVTLSIEKAIFPFLLITIGFSMSITWLLVEIFESVVLKVLKAIY